MVLYPDVQRKAQAELDAVVGHTRLPDFNDYDSLPYINALSKETMRWHLITPLGKSSDVDDTKPLTGMQPLLTNARMTMSAMVSSSPKELLS